MKNKRLLISVLFLVCAVCYLGNFVINGQHPFSSGAAGVSCLLLSILYVIMHVRSGER
jgi:Ca2+/Na+ antiporter